jgi:lipopolysaccharide export system permease protein
MRTLHKYLLRDFLTQFGISLLVITLVLYLGGVMRSLDYIARGVPGGVLLRIFTLNIPYFLTMSIPISVMVAVLLQFGRLSLDGELTAMRSGGLSTWQIISPVVLASIGLSFVCLLFHTHIAPESRFARRQALVNVEDVDPLDLLDEGRFVRFPGLEIFVAQKSGRNLQDVEVIELNDKREVIQNIRANSGTLTLNPDDKLMRIRLDKVQVSHPDAEAPTDMTRARIIDMDVYEFDVSYSELMDSNSVTRNIKDMRAMELMDCIRNVERYFPNLDPRRSESTRMRALVEAHKRIGLSLACLSFCLIGIPLGVTSRRKESQVGIPIGIGVIMLFYSVMAASDSLRNLPWIFPDYLIWIPVIACQIQGIRMLRRLP